MKQIIVVAGATGNLGERIVRELIIKGAEVRVIVRSGSSVEKVNHLLELGARIYKIDAWTIEQLSKVCEGASCVVSSLAGLREVIIDAQKVLLDAAIKVGVPRFIPSDYSLDFTKFTDGENRNLDLRREFHVYLDQRNIAATSIFNGAFTELITGEMPLIFFKQSLVLFWGNADYKWAFTTMDNTAAYTALAAIDESTPRYLSIAGDEISPKSIREVISKVTQRKFRLFRAGGQAMLGIIIKIARKISPGKNELYPAWQGMQYMHNMIDNRSKIYTSANNRYLEIQWTTVEDVLVEHQASMSSSGK